MAVSTQKPVLTSSLALVTDTDANATAETDVKVGAAVLYLVYIDNRANVATSYLKLYNATGPTVGTTAPDMVLPCPASDDIIYYIPKGISFGTGLSFACLTVGGTAGTTGPTNDVTVKLVC